MSRSDEPSAASRSLALPPTPLHRPVDDHLLRAIQLLAVFLKDEILFFEDHPSHVMMHMSPDLSGQLCSRAALGLSKAAVSWDRDWVIHFVLARKRRHHLVALKGRHTLRSQPLDVSIEY